MSPAPLQCLLSKTSVLNMSSALTPSASDRRTMKGSRMGIRSKMGSSRWMEMGLESLPVTLFSDECSLQLLHVDGVHEGDGGDK